ncbi:MAG: tetratricopeptide repeat protein [Bacteroidia bacterium]|nr:tetratricopeptide repeat protein [Bacteroidia bacterium]
MEQLNYLQNLINEGGIEEALRVLDQLLTDNTIEKDTLFYLRGNAYRKQENWQQALNSYQMAIDLNPQSPAVQARTMLIDILNFYHKDMYNQ